MSKRSAATQAAVTRHIKAALAAGLKPGEFDVVTEGDAVRILTHQAMAPASSQSQDDEAWAKGLAKWRRSA